MSLLHIGIKGIQFSSREGSFIVLFFKEYFEYNYSETWNFKNIDKGFITVHDSFKKLEEYHDRQRHFLKHVKDLDTKPRPF